jgi:hypothetical protein
MSTIRLELAPQIKVTLSNLKPVLERYLTRSKLDKFAKVFILTWKTILCQEHFFKRHKTWFDIKLLKKGNYDHEDEYEITSIPILTKYNEVMS